jgi:hypothetical protein
MSGQLLNLPVQVLVLVTRYADVEVLFTYDLVSSWVYMNTLQE